MEDFNIIEGEVKEVEPEAKEEKRSIADKAKGFFGKLGDKAKAGVQKVKDNPEGLLSVFAVAGTAVLIAAGVKADKKIERTVYDDETGECVELRRKLKNTDKIELDRKMREGETKIEALNEMNLIK
jgi:hypothetical protein